MGNRGMPGRDRRETGCLAAAALALLALAVALAAFAWLAARCVAAALCAIGFMAVC